MLPFLKKRAILHEVTILYGTHSGNSKYIAKETSKLLTSKGIVNRVMNASRADAFLLKSEKIVLIIISTHGEGDPPSSTQKFVASLITSPRLENLKFSVCALGDTSYDNYCATGRFIDAQLQLLGAEVLVDRVDCDVDFAQTAHDWMVQITSLLSKTKAESLQNKVQLSKERNIYKAHLVSKQQINKKESTKEVFHLEFECNEFSYWPGDSIGVLPHKLNGLVQSEDTTPRYYSIASTPLEVKNGFHLTVKTHECGLCSPCLNHLLRPGDVLEFIHLTSEEFRLDSSQQPLFLIASGVGIAPFRAFIRHAAQQIVPRDIWLIYGDRNQETDYLYREEWRNLCLAGKITRMDVAFSRDESPTYVQDILHKNKMDVALWVNRGAAIYVCGSVEMGDSVKKFFTELRHSSVKSIPYFEELF